MGPTQRIAQRHEASKSVKDGALHKVIAAKITKPTNDAKQRRSSFWGLPLLASLFGRNKVAEGDDLDGDTIIHEDDTAESTDRDNDVTLVVGDNEYEEEFKDEDEGRNLRNYSIDRYAEYDDPRLAEWTSEETWFFTRLRSRGREPLFDRTWFKDFDFFPDRLFTTDPTQVLINYNHCSMYRAIRAMKNLCLAGPLVRGQLTGGAPPEKPLYREITSFYKWTLADAKLERKAHIPVTAIACAKPRESTESVVSRVTDQLHDLGRQYRDKWRHPASKESDAEQIFTHTMPTLFGFVIKYTVVAIVTCDSSVPRKPIRTQHTADWKVIGQDAWHAMAVAIAFVRQRNYLMQLDAEGALGPEILDQGSDPDA